MKKKIHVMAGVLALCALFLAACQKEEVDTYDVTHTGLNIWVGTSTSVYDAVSYNYSYAYGEGSLTFYARISGVPVYYDRTFKLEAYGDLLDVVAPTIKDETYMLPAGQVAGTYAVHFDSSKLPSADLFSDEDGSISFRVVENDAFLTGSEGMQSFTVTLRNRLAKPDNWDVANYPRVPLSNYFGSYSRVKYQFIIEVTGLVDFTISYFASTAIDESTNTISTAYAVYLQQLVQERLDDYNATHDTPLTDENGARVTLD